MKTFLILLLVPLMHNVMCVIPSPGMVITEDTQFTPGTYSLAKGIIIRGSHITLTMKDVAIYGLGNFTGTAITVQDAVDITIHDGLLSGFYYGIVARNVKKLRVVGVKSINNWANEKTPWLDINIPPNMLYKDRDNLGGGIFLENVTESSIANGTFTHQQNGMAFTDTIAYVMTLGIDMYNCKDVNVVYNNCSYSLGWGIHLYSSTDNIISNNVADYCNRKDLGDSAGILMVYSSHRNQILHNSFRYCGDGFFIGNENGCPSNDNLIAYNDGSFAPANAFECTFSTRNIFLSNIATGSNYGFWLGFSYNLTIDSNIILKNKQVGIQIEHGQNHIIRNNTFQRNNIGIYLHTDGSFPFKPGTCLKLPNQTVSAGYSITENKFIDSDKLALWLENTTDSIVIDNYFEASKQNPDGTISVRQGKNLSFSLNIPKKLTLPMKNIVGGTYLGGNYYSNYRGEKSTYEGIGDTSYSNMGKVDPPDFFPLLGN